MFPPAPTTAVATATTAAATATTSAAATATTAATIATTVPIMTTTVPAKKRRGRPPKNPQKIISTSSRSHKTNKARASSTSQVLPNTSSHIETNIEATSFSPEAEVVEVVQPNLLAPPMDYATIESFSDEEDIPRAATRNFPVRLQSSPGGSPMIDLTHEQEEVVHPISSTRPDYYMTIDSSSEEDEISRAARMNSSRLRSSTQSSSIVNRTYQRVPYEPIPIPSEAPSQQPSEIVSNFTFDWSPDPRPLEERVAEERVPVVRSIENVNFGKDIL